MKPSSITPLLVALCVNCACNEKPKRADEQVKSLEAVDRHLIKQEQEILTRRGALQRERTHLRDKRAELLSKKLTLAETDTEGRQELEQEESKLANLEANLVKQEITLNKKLDTLQTGLVEKLAKDKSSTAREMLAARREYGMALREKDLARRENELSHRERNLARREQTFATRQAQMCPRGGSTVVVQAPSAPGGGSYTRKDVEPVFNSALKAMSAKGILTADLPPGVDRLVTEIRHAVSKRDYSRAKYAADQLLATVRTMRIDRSFIGAKIGRLSAAIRRRPPSGANQSMVNKLFQEATANYGDGRFLDANRRLNKIYALLR